MCLMLSGEHERASVSSWLALLEGFPTRGVVGREG